MMLMKQSSFRCGRSDSRAGQGGSCLGSCLRNQCDSLVSSNVFHLPAFSLHGNQLMSPVLSLRLQALIQIFTTASVYRFYRRSTDFIYGQNILAASLLAH
ncbi:hypothetical protein ATANTOWER_020578 [Ataeniobius toweri]|uniref:Uncharacterized protein n=1 Tax=Ataeniobius toweri TaxID=208326 RepID=A0ABU7BIP7_9TELE|nr:hypothetical protein [Ataeniobius toweri]